MREKLLDKLGVFGGILYFLFSLLVSIMPFVMIDASFWVTFLFFGIEQIIPLSTFIFWIWGLVCAIKGIQDIWAIVYYILFAVMYVPFVWGCVSDLIQNRSKAKKKFRYRPSKGNEAQRRANLFRETVRNEIIASQTSRYPSCEELLMEEMDSIILSRMDEFDSWESDVDFTKVAVSNLYNLTFDMAASGRYHIYRGVMNQTGSQLSYICRSCLEKAHRYGYITEEEKEDQLHALYENIKYVG